MKILTIDRLAKYFIYEVNGNKLLQGEYTYAGSDDMYRDRYMIKTLHSDNIHVDIIRFPWDDLILRETNKEKI